MGTAEEPSEAPATKVEVQVDLLVKAFREAEPAKDIGVAPADWRESGIVDYLYQKGAVLVRDADVERVQAVVGGGRRLDNLVNGLTLLSLEGARRDEALAALDAIDEQLGVGVATPNHVLSVTQQLPTPATRCPATEPEETPTVDPDPGVCPRQRDGDGVLVAVVDTGLLATAATDHAWLAGVTGDIEDPLDAGGLIQPYAGHGTFIAGAVRCMAPGSEVYVERVLAQAGGVLESDIVRQLDEALDRVPDVISLSAGTRSRSNLSLLGFEVFWRRRLRHYKGIVLIAAAGNDGNRGPFWPAAFPWAVSVGALAANWRSRASFSNFGGWVDVYAPGEGLVNAYATGTFMCQEPPHRGEQRQFQGMARWSGTSFSTPLVAGLVAARMSRTGENGRQAADALLATARTRALPGVGAVLLPCAEDGDGNGHPAGCCGHRHRCGRC
jgi:hypothetical protein